VVSGANYPLPSALCVIQRAVWERVRLHHTALVGDFPDDCQGNEGGEGEEEYCDFIHTGYI
jgi:hypothetical protein